MKEQEKQIILSALLRLADNEETLTPEERRDVINELCHGLCNMSLEDVLDKTQNNRKLRIKRGDTTKNDKYTGLAGEITMDLDTKTVRIHDGETVGGIAMARAADAVGDWVVESQLPTAENNYTWYKKYKSGWVEMGGQSTSQAITFPQMFSNKHYCIYAISEMINESVGTISICYSKKSNSSAIIQVRWNGSAQDNAERIWYACGY